MRHRRSSKCGPVFSQRVLKDTTASHERIALAPIRATRSFEHYLKENIESTVRGPKLRHQQSYDLTPMDSEKCKKLLGL